MAFDEKRARELAVESGVETDYAALVRELADPVTHPRLTRMVNDEAAATRSRARPRSSSST